MLIVKLRERVREGLGKGSSLKVTKKVIFPKHLSSVTILVDKLLFTG